jgi:hypothetical protein
MGAELLRLRSRRFVVAAVAIGLAILCLSAAGAFFSSGEPTPADLVAAQERAVAAERECRAAVGSDPQATPGDVEQLCADQPVEQYVDKQPFLWQGGYREGVLAVAVGFAALMFLIGTSAGGAEWSARTMPALLYWEPRRVRVMASKVVALALVAAAVSVVAQLLWLGLAAILVSTRGATNPLNLPDDFWLTAGTVAGRGVLLTVLTALLGFALANLTRNTAAALGVAFVYFAIIESLVSGLRPSLQRWLFGPNVGALLEPGGVELPTGASAPAAGALTETFIRVSNLRGGLWLTLIVAAVLTVATVLFSRRDVS